MVSEKIHDSYIPKCLFVFAVTLSGLSHKRAGMETCPYNNDDLSIYEPYPM